MGYEMLLAFDTNPDVDDEFTTVHAGPVIFRSTKLRSIILDYFHRKGPWM